jgi:transposase
LNVLKPNIRITIATLLQAGKTQREIARVTGVDRKTIRRYARESNSPGVATGSEAVIAPPGQSDWVENPPPRPPALASVSAPPATTSACEIHREWIEQQLALGRNAQSIYQDLVEHHGFTHRYNSVKRFVRGLKAREPERFDVLESLPGEEAQVDYGQGALTRLPSGKYRRPWLFVMTLKYSGKSFRKVVWKADQQSWARLHEEAFRTFGGSVQYVVPDFVDGKKIREDCAWGDAEGLQRSHVRAEPIRRALRAGCLCVQIRAVRPDCHKQPRLVDFAGARIRVIRRVSGIIDEQPICRDMRDRHRRALALTPVPELDAERRVLKPLGVLRQIFPPQLPARDVLALELALNPLKIRPRVHFNPGSPARIQPLFQLRLIRICR